MSGERVAYMGTQLRAFLLGASDGMGCTGMVPQKATAFSPVEF